MSTPLAGRMLLFRAHCETCGLVAYFEPIPGDYGPGIPQHPWIGCAQDGNALSVMTKKALEAMR